MRQLISILIIIILLPSMSVECEDPIAEEPTELPPITQEGADTFGCLIDGEVWVPGSNSRRDEPIYANYPLINRFDIIVFRAVGPLTMLNIRLIDSTNIWEGQRFDFTKRNEIAFDFNYDGCKFVNANVGGQIIAGELFISRFDSGNRFVSGTFWFTAVSDCDTVFVKDGRFDLLFTKG